MTSQSDLERELEKISESVLEDLDPDERAALAVELAAAGEREKAKAVTEAAPTKTYAARDLAFNDQLTDHVVMALYAMWELETGVWRFYYEKADGQLQEARYYQYPDEDWTEAPSEANGYHEQAAMDAAAEFLGNYLAWERYADEQVGVDLETFLGHPFGGQAAGKISTITVTASLASGEHFEEDLGGWADSGTVTVDGESVSPQEYAEYKYAQLTEADL